MLTMLYVSFLLTYREKPVDSGSVVDNLDHLETGKKVSKSIATVVNLLLLVDFCACVHMYLCIHTENTCTH